MKRTLNYVYLFNGQKILQLSLNYTRCTYLRTCINKKQIEWYPKIYLFVLLIQLNFEQKQNSMVCTQATKKSNPGIAFEGTTKQSTDAWCIGCAESWINRRLQNHFTFQWLHKIPFKRVSCVTLDIANQKSNSVRSTVYVYRKLCRLFLLKTHVMDACI